MTVTVFGYLVLISIDFLRFYFSVFALGSVWPHFQTPLRAFVINTSRCVEFLTLISVFGNVANRTVSCVRYITLYVIENKNWFFAESFVTYSYIVRTLRLKPGSNRDASRYKVNVLDLGSDFRWITKQIDSKTFSQVKDKFQNKKSTNDGAILFIAALGKRGSSSYARYDWSI